MIRGRLSLGSLCIALLSWTGVATAAHALEPPELRIAGDWQVQVTARLDGTNPDGSAKTITDTLAVSPAALLTVKAERYASLPLFNPQAGGWSKGAALQGVKAQGTGGPVRPARLHCIGHFRKPESP